MLTLHSKLIRSARSERSVLRVPVLTSRTELMIIRKETRGLHHEIRRNQLARALLFGSAPLFGEPVLCIH